MSSRKEESSAVKKRKEEGKILSEIVNALLSRMKTVNMTSIPKDQRDAYTTERSVLSTLNQSGLAQGVFATCLTFASLRTIPKFLAKRLIARRSSTSVSERGYTLDPPPGTVGNPFQSSKSSADVPSQGLTTTMLSIAKALFDIYASLLVGALVANSRLDETTLLSKIVYVPLVEGRSFVADEFCQSVQDKFAERPNNYWSEVESSYLKQLKMFSDNCKRRQQFEDKIRRDNGMAANAPVSIPSGGVPVDYTIDATATEFENDDFYDDGQEQQLDEVWADNMVSDQEEQGKNDNSKRRW